MANLHVVRFPSPAEFVEAAKGSDDGFMNLAFGVLMDSMNELQIRVRSITEESRTLLAVNNGDTLVLALLKVAGDVDWIIGCPRDRELVSADAETAISLLVSFLPSVIDPKSFDTIWGPEPLVNAFIDTWVSAMAARGLRIEALPTRFRVKRTYATLATLPPSPPHLPSKYIIELANPDDVEPLAHLLVDFSRAAPIVTSIEAARAKMDMHVRLGETWVCREGSEIAGYVGVGRTTFRTVAIRNVYVAPGHRRKGIAEAMTVALMRYYLGARPLGLEGAPDGRPVKGVKEEICIAVVEDFVERLYEKCGFLLGEHDQDPVSEQKGWFASIIRGVRVLEE
ncbi:uncharacterized protein PHACADRAFT_148396 [Phanerochaete carnosa HHB-10118-sp]|uniref:N-acetyltransferase domain-containing protein n=1 Tax=Phanerochaete carnosa (strain HHB-10118-sp) TaxID=650164 RepID=K5W3Y8_PHACS|nr:uncharacterized protein PHACADRAFT_148396 [Phanerochaete carnosa HHB-10118-sp]EKM53659.1 hypothetical protein PHACADRAFT_148396 [Phanerochaete carnosa HHB-10118-sp]